MSKLIAIRLNDKEMKVCESIRRWYGTKAHSSGIKKAMESWYQSHEQRESRPTVSRVPKGFNQLLVEIGQVIQRMEDDLNRPQDIDSNQVTEYMEALNEAMNKAFD